MVEEMYWKYPNEKVVGFYRATTPELILRDPELIKKVMVTDFHSFFYRGFHPYRKVLEPMMQNLFVGEGDLWRMLRTRMTPAFTTAKLKAMFPLVIERAEKLQQRTLNAAASSTVLDARELMARYTTDFIGACAFGLDSDSLNDENSEFRSLGRKIFEGDVRMAATAFLKEVFPETFKSLKYFGRIEADAKQLLSELQKSRNYQPSGRSDFFDMMLEIKNKGAVEIESIEKVKADGTPEKVVLNFDEDIFLGQIMVFFAAGFETSANSTSMTLHLLAFHPEVQKKVQEDIDKAMMKYDNKICYDSIKEMTYLEMAYKEALRIFPPLGYVSRLCSRKYTFDDLGLTVDKEVKMMIPIQALHMDPKYWEDPEEFRPERFHPDNVHKVNKDIYIPFGLGPRNCIGERNIIFCFFS